MGVVLPAGPDAVPPLIHQDGVLQIALVRDVATLDSEYERGARLKHCARWKDLDFDRYSFAWPDG